MTGGWSGFASGTAMPLQGLPVRQTPVDARVGARYNFAGGGGVHMGSIMSAVPGRSDLHPMNVKSGSYVFPSTHVASLGAGNTIAGLDQLNRLFKMGPYGSPATSLKHQRARFPSLPHMKKIAKGGGVEGSGEPTPINAAGGEFVAPPEKILEWMSDNGFKPDLKAGHEELDRWVMSRRKAEIKTLKGLPGPAKS